MHSSFVTWDETQVLVDSYLHSGSLGAIIIFWGQHAHLAEGNGQGGAGRKRGKQSHSSWPLAVLCSAAVFRWYPRMALSGCNECGKDPVERKTMFQVCMKQSGNSNPHVCLNRYEPNAVIGKETVTALAPKWQGTKGRRSPQRHPFKAMQSRLINGWLNALCSFEASQHNAPKANPGWRDSLIGVWIPKGSSCVRQCRMEIYWSSQDARWGSFQCCYGG